MPLPLILGVGAAIAGAIGAGSAIHGASEMKSANDKMKSAERRHERNIAEFDVTNKSACKEMDELGTLECEILKSFGEFSDTIEKIQNRPRFRGYKKDGVTLPRYDEEELKSVSIGAGALLGGLGGAALGAAGGYAAAGAATAAVMALGTASTGTAIASLSGAALTNATLAALGGGAIAAGGGGIALGTTILGAATLGVGLLVGGAIFNATGSKLSDQADEAWQQVMEEENEVSKICEYLNDLKGAAKEYNISLRRVRAKYLEKSWFLFYAVNDMHKTDWNRFSEEEKLATQNTVLLVGLLYRMCQVNLVNKAESGDEMNTINRTGINKAIQDSEHILKEVA